jgi:amino acid transporter
MSSFGMAVQLFLMGIPVIGLILSIVWACGVCRKIARRNLARAWLILLIAAIVLSVAGILVLRFCFPDQLVQVFEQAFPGYTIKWS